MDIDRLNQQLNDALNRWWESAVDYFTHLSQLEMYGWGAMGLGLLLVIVGFILL